MQVLKHLIFVEATCQIGQNLSHSMYRVDDVSLNFVQQALVHEEQKQKDASKPDSSPDSALYGKGY